MGDIAIQVEGLGKRYRIGAPERYVSLRENLTRAVSAPFRKAASLFRGRGAGKNGDGSAGGFIWALKDVSLEVRAGEVVGIIGYNGAGKTTLLKILSRITEPTEGQAEIRGRVGSLLEVGTGFHPELTGRENIYLNGAILGMKRTENERKFDEIVDFAEVETFIDTPVKRYSTGMYVRLAFAVAAHLEPEILLVDEVLSVGDIAFQKKCLDRMSGIAGTGRTILFVSHNLTSITRLCSRGIWIKDGAVAREGGIHQVVEAYRADASGGGAAGGSGAITSVQRKRFSDDLVLQSCLLQDASGREVNLVPFRSGCRMAVRASLGRSGINRASMHLWLTTNSGSRSLVFLSSGEMDVRDARPGDCVESVFRLPDLRLMPGQYEISAGCKVAGAWSDVAYQVRSFQVGSDDPLFSESNADFAPLRVDYEVETRTVVTDGDGHG